ncbi:hypothetical protein [Bacillus sp. S14(2024)]
MSCELNGFKDYDKILEYRIVGEIKAWNPVYGWIPIFFNNDEFFKI